MWDAIEMEHLQEDYEEIQINTVKHFGSKSSDCLVNNKGNLKLADSIRIKNEKDGGVQDWKAQFNASVIDRSILSGLIIAKGKLNLTYFCFIT